MREFRSIGQSKLISLLNEVRRLQLVLACMVIVLCFAIGNDLYRAQSVASKNKDLLHGAKRVINYTDAVKGQPIKSIYHSDLARKYLIDPKAKEQKSLVSVLAATDLCGDRAANIPSLPFTDTATTVGLADNYDLTGDPTACPDPTCTATSGGFADRGAAYLGTGTGPDVAYRLRFTGNTNLKITFDPTDVGTAVNPIGDDMAILFYGATCSSNPADAIVLADNSGSGNPPDLPDNSETITITNLPAGFYHILVDGYTYAGAPASAGPYTITVDCAPSMACLQPLYRRPLL